MENSFYTKKVIERFKNPKNYGKMKDYDGLGKVGNPVCGDILWFYIKIGRNKKGEEVVKDIRFETLGCPAAIATSSVITELAKGKTLEQALEIKREEVINALGGLPEVKIHCSILGVDALRKAIEDYRTKFRK